MEIYKKMAPPVSLEWDILQRMAYLCRGGQMHKPVMLCRFSQLRGTGSGGSILLVR